MKTVGLLKKVLLWTKNNPSKLTSFFGKLFVICLVILFMNWGLDNFIGKNWQGGPFTILSVTMTSLPALLFFAHKKGEQLQNIGE